jgi:hypothetical protein
MDWKCPAKAGNFFFTMHSQLISKHIQIIIFCGDKILQPSLSSAELGYAQNVTSLPNYLYVYVRIHIFIRARACVWERERDVQIWVLKLLIVYTLILSEVILIYPCKLQEKVWGVNRLVIDITLNRITEMSHWMVKARTGP